MYLAFENNRKLFKRTNFIRLELTQDFTVDSDPAKAVIFNNVLEDTSNQYNASTGIITCNRPGLYLTTVSLRCEVSSTQYHTLQLILDGIKHRGQEFFTNLQTAALSQSSVLQLNQGSNLFANYTINPNAGIIKYYSGHVLGTFNLVKLR